MPANTLVFCSAPLTRMALTLRELVDATTYMVDKQFPLRLSKELVEPKGNVPSIDT